MVLHTLLHASEVAAFHYYTHYHKHSQIITARKLLLHTLSHVTEVSAFITAHIYTHYYAHCYT